MRVSVEGPPGTMLALAGPPAVDNAYQFFVDGRLQGGIGDFSNAVPVVYSIQPRIYALSQIPKRDAAAGKMSAMLAFRVWMGPWFLGDPQAGGIHIAPVLGASDDVDRVYRMQWLETFCGYIVDAVEPLVFVLLAMMAWSLIPFERSNGAYRWLIAALLLTAALRENQATYFWGQFESFAAFDVVRNVVLTPLGLGAWTMAFYTWFRQTRPPWLPHGIAVLTLLYIVSQLLSRLTLPVVAPHAIQAASREISQCLRLVFVLLVAIITYRGIRQPGREGWFALPTVLLASVGLFAQELSYLHVPGIWFPFGTGVSRTEYAYAALDVALFALLLRRQLHFARTGLPQTAK